MAENSRYMDGTEFLEDVTEKIGQRLEELKQSLDEGQKEIENMHEYYWENYTEMDQYGYEDFDNQQALSESGERKPGPARYEAPARAHGGLSIFRQS